MVEPLASCSSRIGSARTPGKGSDGPIARKSTFFGSAPPTMKPPMRALSPAPTRRRVEILASRAGGGVGLGVGVGVTVGSIMGVGVGVIVAVGDGVIVVVGVGVAVGVTVGVGVRVG